METKLAAAIARSILCGTAIVGILVAGNAAAEDHDVTVAIHVNTEGLDLSQTAMHGPSTRASKMPPGWRAPAETGPASFQSTT